MLDNYILYILKIDLYKLLNLCKEILSDKPLFVLVNTYSGLSPNLIESLLRLTFKNGNISSSEIGLPITKNDLILPCGISGRVEFYE